MTAFADPFARGPHPVGVRTVTVRDDARGRDITAELYYPATADHAGQDLAVATQDHYEVTASLTDKGLKPQTAVRDAAAADGDFPVLVYSHGFAGDRREATFQTTHLASHGYRVITIDHFDTTFDAIQAEFATGRFNLHECLPRMSETRYGDIPFALDLAEREFGIEIEAAGCLGVSFGGWTAVCAPALDRRITATAPQCPGGVEGPLGIREHNILGNLLRYDWQSDASMLLLVGDRDTWLPLYGQFLMLHQCPGDENVIAVMERADHQHFNDGMEAGHEGFIQFQDAMAEFDTTPNGPPWAALKQTIRPFSLLMPEAEAQAILNGFVTQHMNARLKGGPVPTLDQLHAQASERDLGVYFHR